LCLVATGCATVKVEDTSPREYLAARRGDILSTGHLSYSTTSALFSRGIGRKQCEQDTPRCVERLFDEEGADAVEDDVLAAIAELATADAIRHDVTRAPA